MSQRTPGRTPALARSAERRAPRAEPAALSSHAVADDTSSTASLAVDRADPPEHLFRRLLSAYLAGAPSFEVTEGPALTPTTREIIEEFCRRTRGPKVVSEGTGRLGLRVSDDLGEEDLDHRLLALGAQVVRFHREAVASWDRLSFEDERSWERRDDEIDREAWFLERSIALGERTGRGLGRPATGAWTIARSLERIADHAAALGELGPRLADVDRPGSPGPELRQFHRQAMAHLEEVLQSPDGARANELLDVGEALLTAGRALAERLLPAVGDGSMSPAAAAAVARALESIERTIAYGQDIAQAFFDRSASSSRPVDPTRPEALTVPSSDEPRPRSPAVRGPGDLRHEASAAKVP